MKTSPVRTQILTSFLSLLERSFTPSTLFLNPPSCFGTLVLFTFTRALIVNLHSLAASRFDVLISWTLFIVYQKWGPKMYPYPNFLISGKDYFIRVTSKHWVRDSHFHKCGYFSGFINLVYKVWLLLITNVFLRKKCVFFNIQYSWTTNR